VDTLTAYGPYLALLVALGLVVIPRLAGAWTWLGGKLFGGAKPAPSATPTRADVIAAFDLLWAALPAIRDDLDGVLGPAVLGYRPGVAASLKLEPESKGPPKW
jgi:hypothetical protein